MTRCGGRRGKCDCASKERLEREDLQRRDRSKGLRCSHSPGARLPVVARRRGTYGNAGGCEGRGISAGADAMRGQGLSSSTGRARSRPNHFSAAAFSPQLERPSPCSDATAPRRSLDLCEKEAGERQDTEGHAGWNVSRRACGVKVGKVEGGVGQE